MSGIWKIKKWDGTDLVQEWSASGELLDSEIHTMLQRLVSGNLSDDEIINASLSKVDPNYRNLLEQVGTGEPINYGETPHYTAQFVEH